MERFTAYFADAERKGIKALADEHGASENYFVRVAVRKLLGMPTPSYPIMAGPDVTSVTRNNDPAAHAS